MKIEEKINQKNLQKSKNSIEKCQKIFIKKIKIYINENSSRTPEKLLKPPDIMVNLFKKLVAEKSERAAAAVLMQSLPTLLAESTSADFDFPNEALHFIARQTDEKRVRGTVGRTGLRVASSNLGHSLLSLGSFCSQWGQFEGLLRFWVFGYSRSCFIFLNFFF